MGEERCGWGKGALDLAINTSYSDDPKFIPINFECILLLNG